MARYLSFLRGINVSGKNLLSMDKLKKIYESLGFLKVSTYIQTGNVIFESHMINQSRIAKMISESIKSTLGLVVKVIVLTSDELLFILKNNPFSKKDSKTVYFTILFDKPQEIFLDYLNKFKSPNEEFSILGNIVFLYCPQGYGKTKLSNTFFENKLNVSATTRNYNTMKELGELV